MPIGWNSSILSFSFHVQTQGGWRYHDDFFLLSCPFLGLYLEENVKLWKNKMGCGRYCKLCQALASFYSLACFVNLSYGLELSVKRMHPIK